MDIFRVPLVLRPEERKSIQARMVQGTCLVKFPQPWLTRKKYLVLMVDRIYWSLLIKVHTPELKARAAELNQRFFKLIFREVRYHRQFKRWGSCSSLKNVNLSHRLIGAPQQLADYVILHELAHLEHLNHGKEFWNLVRSTGLNPKLIRSEIDAYGRGWQKNYQQWYNHLSRSI